MKVASTNLSARTCIILFCLAFIPMKVSAQDCCSPNAGSVANERLESARVLTREASNLSEMNHLLIRWSWCLASLTKETPHVDTEQGQVSTTRIEDDNEGAGQFKVDSRNYQQLLAAYQEARHEYLQHKLVYDQHVATFHNQPQIVPSVQPSASNPVSAILVAPKFAAMRLKVEDACAQLQAAESVLTGTEMELTSMINYLSASKGKLDSEMYFQRWTSAQSLGASLQRQVVEYGKEILAKQKNTEAQMHNVEQMAITNGNYRESHTAYIEVQRCSTLNNEETQHAQMHTMFVSNALRIIGTLSPLTGTITPPPGASTPAQYTSWDEIEIESQALQTEYDTMQQKYKEAESANPAHKATKSRAHK
jgi:hypothetical protein